MFMLHAGGDAAGVRYTAGDVPAAWRLFIDTAAETPGDVYPEANGPAVPATGRIKLVNHSLRCYVA